MRWFIRFWEHVVLGLPKPIRQLPNADEGFITDDEYYQLVESHIVASQSANAASLLHGMEAANCAMLDAKAHNAGALTNTP